MELSVVIPVFNERESLSLLHEGISRVLSGRRYEILFVDDGSSDGSAAVLDSLCWGDPLVRVLRLRRNFGKAEALAIGFKEAQGQVVVTMDGDLQDDPEDIPRLLALIDQGYDLVSGWKVHRRDPLSKRLPSRLFNWVTGRLSGLPLHDINSGLKAYRRQVIQDLPIYGEQHRFIPVLAYWRGFRVGEIGVTHHPRNFGKSKFGAWRFLAGFLDLFTVLFLTRFRWKPLHLFGSVGFIFFLVGVLINVYLTYLWFGGERIGTRPLLQLGVLLMVVGVQFLSLGLLGEMITSSTAHTQEKGRFYEAIDSPLTTLVPSGAIGEEGSHGENPGQGETTT
ncbi:MAG: glycosyltransferase family 2 protein [Chloroflexi bacterium]|nr:glycosyltransferase family 2 protein [Chloroflexota bacterium]